MKIDEKLSASGAKPLTSHQGLCPWTPLGALQGPQARHGLALYGLAMVRPSPLANPGSVPDAYHVLEKRHSASSTW